MEGGGGGGGGTAECCRPFMIGYGFRFHFNLLSDNNRDYNSDIDNNADIEDIGSSGDQYKVRDSYFLILILILIPIPIVRHRR